ncbi:unnamed protein product [Staurois parvus]|uniref:Uncharacterized protein n=1 Tax=Staurois parvus TaxID=386267 RepID=A0ABN9FFB5_9NEOB|nr:unnamed protein product [Staurois parvus]
MVRDCRHTTGDDQRLQTYYRRWSETADILQEMTRDCRHTTGDDQRLQTVQEMTRDCRHSTGDDQRLQTQYRRWSESADILQEMDGQRVQT